MTHTLACHGTATAPADWDDWLQSTEAGFCQTTLRAQMDHALNGSTYRFLSVMEGGHRIAGALIGARRPAAPRTAKDLVKAAIPGRRATTALCMEGPAWAAPSPLLDAAADHLADALLDYARAEKAALRIMPPRWSTAEPSSWAAALLARGFVAKEWMTSLIDLTQSEVDLLANARPNVRKALRKARESGIEVEECRDYDTYVRDFRTGFVESHLLDTGDRLRMEEDSPWWEMGRTNYRFFVAKAKSGGVLAMLGTYRFRGIGTEIMSGRTRLCRDTNLPAQDLLHYEVFLAHKRSGDRRFDLAGYSAEPADEKERGIRFFKEKWGGEQRRYREFGRSEQTGLLGLARDVYRRFTK